MKNTALALIATLLTLMLASCGEPIEEDAVTLTLGKDDGDDTITITCEMRSGLYFESDGSCDEELYCDDGKIWAISCLLEGDETLCTCSIDGESVGTFESSESCSTIPASYASTRGNTLDDDFAEDHEFDYFPNEFRPGDVMIDKCFGRDEFKELVLDAD